MERGLKVVFAMVDLVTLGGAIVATKFSEMGLKEGLKAFGKTALIDFMLKRHIAIHLVQKE